MGGAEAAELAKLAETTYRDVNIAFANELARYADGAGIDVERVIDAANSQPFSHIHRPGRSPSAATASRSTRASTSRATPPPRCRPRRARSTRRCPPTRSSAWPRSLGDLSGKRVLILGVAYRGGVKETAFSGAFALRDALLAAGARASGQRSALPRATS